MIGYQFIQQMSAKPLKGQMKGGRESLFIGLILSDKVGIEERKAHTFG